MARIWHVSDTHCNLDKVKVPENIDILIHTGDATNIRDPYRNNNEMRRFIERLEKINIPVKIFVAGNHDTSMEKGLVTKGDFEAIGVHYLYNESVEVNGLKVWGSPYTPTFGRWAFQKSRQNIGELWENIPDNTDVIATHGPPLGMLDLTNRRDLAEQCGDRSLLKRVVEIEPKAVLFGHIHNTTDICNSGTKTIEGMKTIFSNGACATDGKFGRITSHGNIITL